MKSMKRRGTDKQSAAPVRKRVVVKIQQQVGGDDLAENAKNRICLIYPASRSPMTQQPVPEEVIAAMGSDPKGYFMASWDRENERWDVYNRVEDRAW